MSAIRSGELLTKITTKVVVTGSTRNKLRRQLVCAAELFWVVSAPLKNGSCGAYGLDVIY
jgi:hypothetical protein